MSAQSNQSQQEVQPNTERDLSYAITLAPAAPEAMVFVNNTVHGDRSCTCTVVVVQGVEELFWLIVHAAEGRVVAINTFAPKAPLERVDSAPDEPAPNEEVGDAS